MSKKTVWKFNVPACDLIEINMPLGAQVLSIQEQHGEAQLWCLCDPNEEIYEKRIFRLAGTGHPIQENNLEFVGTFQLYDGDLVFHLFEVK